MPPSETRNVALCAPPPSQRAGDTATLTSPITASVRRNTHAEQEMTIIMKTITDSRLVCDGPRVSCLRPRGRRLAPQPGADRRTVTNEIQRLERVMPFTCKQHQQIEAELAYLRGLPVTTRLDEKNEKRAAELAAENAAYDGPGCYSCRGVGFCSQCWPYLRTRPRPEAS